MRRLAFNSVPGLPTAENPGRASWRRRLQDRSGAVLLEVVLALVLFVAAATVISSAMSGSLDSVERQRLKMHGADLAVSVLSELQLGIRSPGQTAPAPFEAPFEDWAWEVLSSPTETESGEAGGLTRVEVVIRRKQPAVVVRLAQVMRLDSADPGSGTP